MLCPKGGGGEGGGKRAADREGWAAKAVKHDIMFLQFL